MANDPPKSMFQPKLSADDFCLPIYLDQQTVFDMLAVLEGGLVNVSQVKNSIGRTDSEASSMTGSIRIRLLELFNIGLNASQNIQGVDSSQEEILETRTHTPVSLFCKLRSGLIHQDLVTEITDVDQLKELSPGSFVEIKVRLQKSPIVEIFDRLVKIIELIYVSPDHQPIRTVTNRGKNGKKVSSSPVDSQEELISQQTQLKNFHDQLTKSGSTEVIGLSITPKNITAVVTLNRDSFVKSESEFIGNVFTILGKVANVIPPGSDDKINLLARTALAGINTEFIYETFSRLNNAEEFNLVLPGVVTEIKGPAMQIIPIAVFL